MVKRILAIVLVAWMFPVMGFAADWALTTWVRTAGGTLQIDNGAYQTSVDGGVTNYFTDGSVKTVFVRPNSGYRTTSVVFNGVTLTNPTETAFTVSGPNNQSVLASFGILKYSVSASVAGNVGGTVTAPAGVTNLNYGAVLTTAKTFTFTPSGGYRLATISGIPAGASQSPAVPLAGQQVNVTFPAGFTLTTSTVLVGTFIAENPIAKAGSSQSVFIGSSATLNGTGSLPGNTGISSYFWSQVSGPPVVLLNATAATASFTSSVVGDYVFTLTVMPGGSTSSTTVTVYGNLPALARTQCYNCHSAAGVGVATNVFGNWSSSGHKAKGVICARCHVGADTGMHPGSIIRNSVSSTTFDYNFASAGSGNFCVSCHSPTIITDFAASRHSIRAGSASCSFCHVNGVHNPGAACTDCHKADNAYGLAWPPPAFTFHSNFTSSSSVCKVCHTTHNPKVLSIKTSCP
ncbi:MAG: hypothetical protein WCK54_19790 [Desulfuromonadales bacterium]